MIVKLEVFFHLGLYKCKIEKYLKKGDIKKKQDPVGPSHVKSVPLVK